MPTENEIKFILPKDLDQKIFKDWESLAIRQGYLNLPPHINENEGAYSFSYAQDGITIDIALDKRDYKALASSASASTLKEGTVRLRQENSHYELTYKQWHDDGIDKRLIEIERRIDNSDFATLWPSTDNRIRKTRFIKHDGEIEWMADFLENDNNDIYFVLAEAEMPEGMETPPCIPEELTGHILFTAAKDDLDFTNKRLSDPEHARKMIDKIMDNNS